MAARYWWIAFAPLIAAGCTFPVSRQVNELINDRAHLGADLQVAKDDHPDKDDAAKDGKKGEEKGTTLEKRLKVPEAVPGSAVKPLEWPDPKAPKGEVAEAVKKYIGEVPKLQPDPDFPLGPEGRPLTLSDLQRIASANSPVLRQAASDIEGARGAAVQAGLYPNPTLGYQSAGAGPGGGPNYGMFVGQTIKTFGKLKLAQSAALMDLNAAELAFIRAENDLRAAVRSGYYSVLVAQESIRANRGLVELTDEVYRVMVDQLKVGEVGAYEPLQLAVFSAQARTGLVQARNARILAWKQLAATLGTPHMPPTAVEGNIRRAAPKLDFDKALGQILAKHTDVLTAATGIEKARYNLRLAQVTPYPDVNVQAGVYNDATPPGPARIFPTVGVSVPIPVFDLNQGAVRQAQASLVRANEEPHRVQADLTSRFSEAYRRYEENRVLLEMYHKTILPKQVQAFRSAVKRHFGGEVGGVAYNDLVTSEQTLVTVVGNYLGILQSQWQAVVDVSSLLQTDQLYKMADDVNSAPDVDFDELLKLPCGHTQPARMPMPERLGFSEAASLAPSAGPQPPQLVAPAVMVPVPVQQ